MWKLVLVALLSAACADDWAKFKHTYKKRYCNAAEEAARRAVFELNSQAIAEHNEQYNNALHTFNMSMNHLGDLSSAEVARRFNGYRSRQRTTSASVDSCTATEDEPVPEHVDWRDKGLVTGVKDQGECGACWAFSATGSIEGQHALKHGHLVSLSEQNLIDCSRAQSSEGCDGGDKHEAFRYVEKNKGIDTEHAYPYEAEDDKCRFKRASVGAYVAGCNDIPKGDERALTDAIATHGPISVAIDASHRSFQFYSHGVYYEHHCSSKSKKLDHGVLAVGYGTSRHGHAYYIVKNSFGKKWGDKGYILMSRNRHNNCGIATEGSWPSV